MPAGCRRAGRAANRSQHSSLVQQDDAVGQLLDFRQGVRGEKNGRAVAFHQLSFQKPAEFGGGDGIETARWLIQQQHAGTVNHGPRQSQAMDLAGGKGPHLAVDECAHPHQFGQFFKPPGRFRVEQIVHGGKEVKIFARGEPFVEAAVGGGVKSKLGADLRTLPFDIVSGDAGAAARRHQQGGQNA